MHRGGERGRGGSEGKGRAAAKRTLRVYNLTRLKLARGRKKKNYCSKEKFGTKNSSTIDTAGPGNGRREGGEGRGGG